MNQKIFDLELSVETISAYLLCCSLEDAGTVISTKNLTEMWNSTKESLIDGLQDLEARDILRKIISDRAGNNVYQLSDAKNWRLL
jgi:hypothetical protein